VNNTTEQTLCKARFSQRCVSSVVLSVHTHPLEELDVSDYATRQDIDRLLASLQAQYKCSTVLLDVKKDVIARLEKNG